MLHTRNCIWVILLLFSPLFLLGQFSAETVKISPPERLVVGKMGQIELELLAPLAEIQSLEVEVDGAFQRIAINEGRGVIAFQPQEKTESIQVRIANLRDRGSRFHRRFPPLVVPFASLDCHRLRLAVQGGHRLSVHRYPLWGRGFGNPRSWRLDRHRQWFSNRIGYLYPGRTGRPRPFGHYFVFGVDRRHGSHYLPQWRHAGHRQPGISKLAKTPRTVQFATWLMGLIIFFDDYANTLVVGNTMRSITDKLRVSREKLSYIVDSTAAPVAALAFITTWIVGRVGLYPGRDSGAGKPSQKARVLTPSSSTPWLTLFTRSSL